MFRFQSIKRLTRGITIVPVLLLSLFTSLLFAGQTDTLYILQTTDVHGRIYPYNYVTDHSAPYGLARAYSKITEYRLKHQNVLLIDSGDLLQGTPLTYYFNKIEDTRLNPMILVMNYMGYDAFTVGNHDIEQGVEVYYKAMKESNFAWLSANGVLPDGRTFFEPYTLFEVNGIRVGVLGLTTPGIPMWLDSTLYPGIDWEDMVQSARYWAEQIRPHVDVLVGSFHAGFNADYSAEQTDRLGLPNENASRLVAEQIPQFDVVFAGHSHRQIGRKGKTAPQKDASNFLQFTERTTLLLNAGAWAQNLAVAQIIVQPTDSDRLPYKVLAVDGWLEPLNDVPASKAILDLALPFHKKTLEYTRTVICTLTDSLSAAKARWQDTPFMDLIHQTQLHFSGADISFAACFDDRFALPPGTVRVKDVYKMYRYENFLYTVEMTGQQIKDFLEYSARYYQLKDGKLKHNPKVAGYNYDMAEGISYKIDVRKPVGRRIVDLTDLKTGQPLDMKKTYRVAMNSYRATGGGGHMAAAKAKNAPIIFKSDQEIRNLLIEYMKAQKVISPRANGNWKIVR